MRRLVLLCLIGMLQLKGIHGEETCPKWKPVDILLFGKKLQRPLFPTRNSLMEAKVVKWVKVPVQNETSTTNEEPNSSDSAKNSTDESQGGENSNMKRSKKSDSPPEKQQEPNSSVISTLVFFFYAPQCPYSNALRPVMECLPKYFSENKIAFIAQDNTGPPAPNFKGGVIATPAIKLIDQHETGHTFIGSRKLSSLVKFVQNVTGVEPVAVPNSDKNCVDSVPCRCDFNVEEVSPQQIAESSNNVWMLLSVLFIAWPCPVCDDPLAFLPPPHNSSCLKLRESISQASEVKANRFCSRPGYQDDVPWSLMLNQGVPCRSCGLEKWSCTWDCILWAMMAGKIDAAAAKTDGKLDSLSTRIDEKSKKTNSLSSDVSRLVFHFLERDRKD